MIMFGLYLTGKVPFDTVYFHGMVNDEKNQKMSKSKGNVVSPITMIETFGTGKIAEEKIIRTVKDSFNLTPQGIIKTFGLRRPIFRQTACFGHFGQTIFPWEKTDKINLLIRNSK